MNKIRHFYIKFWPRLLIACLNSAAWRKEESICSNEGSRHFSRGDNHEKNGFKSVFFQKHWANQILHKSSLRNPGIQVCSNERLCPFPRGDNYEIAKIRWRIKKKIFFPRTTGPISTDQIIFWWWGFKLDQILMKGTSFFKGVIITKYWKYIDEI